MNKYNIKYAWYENKRTVIKNIMLKAFDLKQLNKLLIDKGIYFTKEITLCQ